MSDREIPGLSAVLEREIYEHCFSATDREVGGVLVGTMRPGSPPVVEASIPALRAAESAAQLTFTQDAWEHIHRVLETEYPSRTIVGWYHTHPGYGLFLSDQDLFIHRNFFQNHGQIALVVDPVAREEAVFAWYGDDVREFGRRRCAWERNVPSRRRPSTSAGADPDEGIRTISPESSGSAEAHHLSPRIAMREHRPTLSSGIYFAAIGIAAGTIAWELLLK
jgi:proteasome lid subunit RPN8/RPN11